MRYRVILSWLRLEYNTIIYSTSKTAYQDITLQNLKCATFASILNFCYHYILVQRLLVRSFRYTLYVYHTPCTVQYLSPVSKWRMHAQIKDRWLLISNFKETNIRHSIQRYTIPSAMSIGNLWSLSPSYSVGPTVPSSLSGVRKFLLAPSQLQTQDKTGIAPLGSIPSR